MSVFRAKGACIGVAAIHFLAAPAWSGPITDLAQQAEEMIASDKGTDAYDKIRTAMEEVSDQIPFDIRRAFFVTSPPEGFSSYNRVKENEFPQGSSLITYAEPIGLSWKQAPGNLVTANFTVDFELRNPEGEILAAQKAFGNYKIQSHEPLMEIYTPLTLDVSKIGKGDYVLKYVFSDVNSGKTTSIEQRFKLK